MQVSIFHSTLALDAQRWNALAGNHPFTRYEFLANLEKQHCATPATGWTPRFLVAHEGEHWRGAVPAYLKTHSYGEYVFDWAWADAFARHGLRYYPKLVCAIPFTPVTGPRLLIAPGASRRQVTQALYRSVHALSEQLALSSIHWLFPDPGSRDALRPCSYLWRSDVQLHWFNEGYRHFDDFLSRLHSRKRKNIRRERRQIRASGITVDIKSGNDITDNDLVAFYRCYSRTALCKSGQVYLTLDFFRAIAAELTSHVVLFLARRGTRIVGAAWCLRDEETLYGRHWGCLEPTAGLHFETCYYTPIEYCIEEHLARLDGGAQGEHKLARGFRAVETVSAHWIHHPGFRHAIDRFLDEERTGLSAYREALARHTPFRHGATMPSGELPRTPLR